MQFHGSCGERDGAAVLMTGPSGSGKSDLLLRLLDRSFFLVADDRVDVCDDGYASAPDLLRGLLEVRGLGILRLPFTERAGVALVIELGPDAPRLPAPATLHPALRVPVIKLDPAQNSAPERVARALDCATGRLKQIAGAFAA